MKVLSFDAERCTGCYICEEVCSKTWFKAVDRDKSAIVIRDGDGPLLSSLYCVQLGDCINVCPTEAIYRDKRGIVRIRRKLCVGCLSCIGFCPYLAMLHHREHSIPFKCVACGKCADECPADALEIVEVETPSSPGIQTQVQGVTE